MSDQLSCRICRGEATPSQPLFHPCKCRGSIKYIHQECLLEWLKHTSKSTKQCDICNTVYQFRTIYDPAMPERIPTSLMLEKLQSVVSRNSVKFLSIVLYLVCLVLQVPIFWKFVGRIYTWAIDGSLPPGQTSFVDALFFGDAVPLEGSSLRHQLVKIGRFFNNTYFSGFRYIVVYIVVHLALFVEHEWVVRDESYTKLLMKKIGKEPRAKLVDMLHNALDDLRQDSENGNQQAGETLNRLEMLARAINDIQEDANNEREDNVLAEIDVLHHNLNEGGRPENGETANGIVDGAAESDQIDTNGPDSGADVFEHPPVAEGAEVPAEHPPVPSSPSQNPPVPSQNPPTSPQSTPAPPQSTPAPNLPSDSDTEAQPPQHIPIAPNLPNRDLQNIVLNEGIDNETDDDDDGMERDEELAQQLQQEENGDIFEVLGLSLDLYTPLFLMAICDTVIVIYMFLTYLIPHTLGTVMLSVTAFAVKIGYKLAAMKYNLHDNAVVQRLMTYEIPNAKLSLLASSVGQVVVAPSLRTFNNLFVDPPSHFSMLERTFVLTLGYVVIIMGVGQLMKGLTSGKKPIMGSARTIYKILFEVTLTLKVFVVFAIEIFLFPVYCGWLLDMCISPLVLDSFVTQNNFNILFTSNFSFLSINYVRVIVYWGLGTLYMLFFALFIGMIRSKILRPGVLYFIRSPEDPNARLIHDALVKPFGLQLSRIYLSAKVYTGFIIFGIGGVTWGLRYLVSAGQQENTLLPLTVFGYFQMVFVVVLCSEVVRLKPILSHYLCLYWKRAFELACHKVRMSHFILGKPIAQERGYIVYRTVFESMFSAELPDYTKPVSYREAVQLLEADPDVKCCFVPDGGYIRVPDNDTVSRTFAKQLFVAVTKDDKLLEEIGEIVLSDDEDGSEDDSMNSDDNYVIVYRPPNWKWKCFHLILLLWVFAIVLIVGSVMVAAMLGRPFVKAFTIVSSMNSHLVSAGGSSILDSMQKDINLHNWRLMDLGSIAIGMVIQTHILNFFHRNQDNGQNDVGQAEGFGLNLGFWGNNANRPAANEQPDENMTLLQALVLPTLFLVLLTLNTVWEVLVHKFVIDVPIRVLLEEPMRSIPEDFLVTPATVAVHGVVFVMALYPLVRSINRLLRARDIHRQSIRQMMAYSGISRLLLRIVCVVVPSAGWLYYRSPQFQMADLLGFPACYVTFYVAESAYKLKGLLDTINEQVKNEKYVRGRALENYSM